MNHSTFISESGQLMQLGDRKNRLHCYAEIAPLNIKLTLVVSNNDHVQNIVIDFGKMINGTRDVCFRISC